MSGLEFGRGELWPLLALAPLLWLLCFLLIGNARRGAFAYGAELGERVPSRVWSALRWTAIAVILLVAWMDPRLGVETVQVERRGLDVIFCLDTSRSMLARDAEPNRLERAKRDVRAMLPELVGGDRVGLVAFAGEARLIVPLTHDLDSFERLLARVDTDVVRRGGSDLALALRRALEIAEPGGDETTAIVMLTDGEDLSGAGRQAAAEVAARGIRLHTVGYGSTRGSKITLVEGQRESFLENSAGDEVVSVLDADGLRSMSAVTGGDFVRAEVVPLPLVELKRKRLDPMLQRAYDAGEEVLTKPRFQWVLLFAVLLLWIEMLIAGGGRR